MIVDFIGIIAALWHILWIAGLLLVVSGSVAFVVYAAHCYSLQEEDKNPTEQIGVAGCVKEPGVECNTSRKGWHKHSVCGGTGCLFYSG